MKIYRKFLEWQWFGDSKMVQLFVYLLLSAAVEEKKWRNITIGRGQLVITRKELSETLQVSEKNVRTCLDRLEECGVIERKATNKFTIVTICKYEDYQVSDKAQRPTNGQQTANNWPTNGQQAEKEVTPHTPLKNKDIIQEGKNRRSYYYSLGARALTREEKEQQQFFYIFYLKGAADPAAEVSNFLSWNTSPDRVAAWEKCPEYARYSTASRWQVKGAKRPGFDPAAGKIFTEVIDILNKGHPGILEQICRCTSSYPFTVKETAATLACNDEIRDIVEKVNTETGGQIKAVLNRNKIYKLLYAVYGPKNQNK